MDEPHLEDSNTDEVVDNVVPEETEGLDQDFSVLDLGASSTHQENEDVPQTLPVHEDDNDSASIENDQPSKPSLNYDDEALDVQLDINDDRNTNEPFLSGHRTDVSPGGSMISGPDDTPSIQGSIMSSPRSSVVPSPAIHPPGAGQSNRNSLSQSFRPFDRRFTSRLSSTSPSQSPRTSMISLPSYSHARNTSVTSQLWLEQIDSDSQTPPWEVVRWTKLQKLTGQAFSEVGKRNFGSPTYLAVGSHIFLGTTSGVILMFDYSQNLKAIIGSGSRAVKCGAITSLAVSSDYTTVAAGHADGSIFTWETSKPARPFLSISPAALPVQGHDRSTDGHVPNIAVTHIGFLGTRRTALVSADDHGMAFSHLATRGTGSLGRTVKTTRILGRYPSNDIAPTGKPLKPSAVLAFSPLPLGNAERGTDTMGLTAMLTPYLLVIVSTTPVAQTQHKAMRPRDITPQSTISGCIAWFPAGKLRVPDAATGSTITCAKLIYCWSNILTILDVDEIPSENPNKQATLEFKSRSRWKCDEAIVAVQWLSRSVITILTITQRLIVLEDRSMRVTDAFDLIHKYIYHADLFSQQLEPLVGHDNYDEDGEMVSTRGAVADAFYMSFKSFKGRLFLLGFEELSIGALSTWHDRLMALMNHGDYTAAVQLAISYYTGDSDKLTVGLPEDNEIRHSMVKGRIFELMNGCLDHITSQLRRDPNAVSVTTLKDLIDVCFVACETIDDLGFLFGSIFEWYLDQHHQGLFLETLEAYILLDKITMVPPVVMKHMVSHFVAQGFETRLEELICHLDTSTLDLDQITGLCKEHGLYDALIYVWNQGLSDYITPLTELLALLVSPRDSHISDRDELDAALHGINAVKIFPYLSYTLTGRVYPTGDYLSDDVCVRAKSELYWFLFSGSTIEWPLNSGKRLLTCPTESSEPSFPYLQLILQFDAPSFLSALNETFEDSFLNDSPDKKVGITVASQQDMPEEQIFGKTVDRQYVASILLELLVPPKFTSAETIYLDMFIARNLAKFPQYLVFPGSTLSRVLTGLCQYPSPDLLDDAQLSAEYLLSIFKPADMDTMMTLFHEARFYRILKRIYSEHGQYEELVAIYLEDPHDQQGVFSCLEVALYETPEAHEHGSSMVIPVILKNAEALVNIDFEQAASAFKLLDGHVQHEIIQALSSDRMKYDYITALFAVDTLDSDSDLPLPPNRSPDLVEQYLKLMCSFDPLHVSDYIDRLDTANLHLDELVTTFEGSGVIDAAIMIMTTRGLVTKAMGRLKSHLEKLETSVVRLLEILANSSEETSPESFEASGAVDTILLDIEKYVKVGTWLCNYQTTRSPIRTSKPNFRHSAILDGPLSDTESMWLELIAITVSITKSISNSLEQHTEPTLLRDSLADSRVDSKVRGYVQHVFTALLTATTTLGVSRDISGSAIQGNSTFLRILKAFLTQAAVNSPSLADLGSVLTSIFSAYAYEESILHLSNRLLSQNLFLSVSESITLRQRGWRPRGSACEACGLRVWGPGVSANIYTAWEKKQAQTESHRLDMRHQLQRDPNVIDKGKSLAKEAHIVDDDSHIWADRNSSTNVGLPDTVDEAETNQVKAEHNNVVLLACRHIFHQKCLIGLQKYSDDSSDNQAVVDCTANLQCPLHE